jgi:cell division transport system permease protein
MNKRSSSSVSRFNFRKAFRIWLMQHAQACVFSMGQLFKNPLNTLLTTAVVGIALSLPAGFYLLLENCQRVASNWDNSAEISLFLKLDIDEERAISLMQELRQFQGVVSVDHISKDAALHEFQRQSGFNQALVALESNPLPAIILLQPALDQFSSTESDLLMKKLRALPEVDTAQFDRQWIQRLFAILEIIRQAVVVLSVLLALAVLLIVGNTIRLSIYNRRTEIEVNKLFGATEAFIQRPYLYSGLFHGAGGSLLAWVLLSLSLFLLNAPVSRLAGLYSSDFSLQGLSITELLLLLLGGGMLGLLGSWVSVQQHVKAIEPV